ncbi:M14 family metallopeptidase [uncultured Ruminococcus sp.]|uniref:M14 family metallopeptidase n=1 Tax=uncultured Ruminococcus sp. TaxID=165186 RepID=UPI00260D6C89|nr:M14 family metallopeptidase [uncultured Ruminococcus sp.]
MKKEILYSLKSPYRESLDVVGYRFGKGEKALAVVGAIRGNEVQQMYICSQLIRKLKQMEQEHRLNDGVEILVIPCVNYYSMNIGKRFWPMDNTDINRMFPGYDLGETTQRIADGIFQKLQGYTYGIQLTSFYQTGNFLPHVKMMETQLTDHKLMKWFGLQYGIMRTPRPYDTTTLNYNWQIWETNAFSLYSSETDAIDESSSQAAVEAILRFMNQAELATIHTTPGYQTELVEESNISQIRAGCGGIFRASVKIGEQVTVGQVIGQILDPFEGTVLAEITADHAGVLYFSYHKPLIHESTVCFKIIHS